MNYQETLDIVEKFMIDSRIREYCTEVCKGHCCQKCYTTNKETCRKCEGRRLSCSIYMCSVFYDLLPAKCEKTLREVKKHIIGIHYKHSGKNPYFSMPDKSFFEEAQFSSKILQLLDDEVLKEVKKITTKLINYNLLVYKAANRQP